MAKEPMPKAETAPAPELTAPPLAGVESKPSDPPTDEGPRITAPVSDPELRKYKVVPISEKFAVTNFAVGGKVYKVRADGSFLVDGDHVRDIQRCGYRVTY